MRPSPTVQVLGAEEVPADSTAPTIRRRALAAGLFLVIATFVLLAVGLRMTRDGRVPSRSSEPEIPADSSLLHSPGEPVDVVEQFIAALNYGNAGAVVQAIAPEAGSIELPFLSTTATPARIVGTMDVYREIHAVIEMFGCSVIDPGSSEAPAEVHCAISYDNDYIRELEAENLRGTMRLYVQDDQIIGSSVLDLNSLADSDRRRLQDEFDRWLLDRFRTAG